jgi:hypothetical protein
MTGSFYSVNRNSTTGSGLHTLVEGLTISPSSPVSSSATTTQSSFNSSSIFNNPNQSSSFTPLSTPSSTPGNAGAQTFTARKLSYAVGAGQTNNLAVKEVDDPTSTPSNSKSQLLNSSRPSHETLSPAAYGPGARCNSYRGPVSLTS